MQKGDRWWRETTDGELPSIPWMHADTTAFWGEICKPWMTVLEFGGGGSTVWLAERVAHVTTYEENEYWYNKLVEKRPDNVTLINALGPPTAPPRYAMLSIDGARNHRAKWIEAAPSLCMPGGIIVVDNCNRPEYSSEYRDLRAMAAKWEEIDRNTVVDQVMQVETYSQYFVTGFLWMPE